MITEILSQKFGHSFIALDLPAELGRVTVSDRPDLADYQCNGALQAAKLAKKNPREIASNVVAHIQENDTEGVFEKIEIAGPGFINIRLSQDFLNQQLQQRSKDDRLGIAHIDNPETIMLDFCGPNVAKAMHVGHLRTTLIGDVIRRILRFAGHKTIADVHFGDWGLPYGILINELSYEYPDLKQLQPDAKPPFDEDLPITLADLARLYPQGSQRVKDDETERKKARIITAQMQDGHPGYAHLLEHFVKVTIPDVRAKTDFLGVEFDLYLGEKDTQPVMQELFDDLQQKNILQKDGTAQIIPVAQEDDNQEIPPLMMEKSDGGFTYGTTDVATIYMRQIDYQPDRIIYVVDQRQSLHFQQVFRAVKQAGYTDGIELTHVGYGTMNGPDGKPFKTRSGDTVTLDALLDMTMQKSAERLKEIELDQKVSADEFATIQQQIAVGALRFGELQNTPKADYQFDLERFVSFEGKTGPYLQYTAVRLCRLIDKAQAAGIETTDYLTIDAIMRSPLLTAMNWPENFVLALRDYAPNIVSDYLFRLAQEANSFYQNAPVIQADDAKMQSSYLTLLIFAHKTLTLGLDVLGIEVPEQM